MTGRRRPSSPRPFPRVLAAATAATACTAVLASLLSACGSLPGAPEGSGEKEPLTVMTWAPVDTKATNMPGMPAMAEAYARWVNSRGGLDGHPLKVVTCNEHNDSVAAARCAQRAVDVKAVAVVGSYSQFGRSFISPLERNGIPYLGGYGVSDEEFASPLSYPVNGGQAALLAGNGRQLASVCDRVSLVRPDTIQGDQMPALLSAGLADGSRAAAKDVRAPEDGTDYADAARRALDGVDAASGGTGPAGGTKGASGCVTATLGERTDTFFDSFRRLQPDGSKVRIASVLGSAGQALVDRTGGRAGPLEGAYLTGWYPVASDPRWNPMRKVINDHAFGDNRIDPADPGVQTTWIAYTVLRAVVERLGKQGVQDITAHTVQQALDRGEEAVDTGGLTPKLRWRSEDMLAVQDFPRTVNALVTYQAVREGQLVAAKEGFVNVAGTLERPRADS
ncbi:ABC transporter substrate-binding protein [Streptomyces monomycini]|uniref:ABC transporter substrate-binding protein n=1 Tax=Streptomyces monomycini TaxID=371720 RepID=UPI0004AAD6CD|nr:ABC transporter substrate-binding protein [Streptomyces monomycini]